MARQAAGVWTESLWTLVVRHSIIGFMQSGQVSVWIPIIVGLIGLVGVLAGQVLSVWREQRNEAIRAGHQRGSEDRQNLRDDRRYWRDRRIAIGAEFLVGLNAWRELAVDEWQQLADEGAVGPVTREQLTDVVTRVSDQRAHIRLIGTDAMGESASSAVDRILKVSLDTRSGIESSDSPDVTAASAALSEQIRQVREVFRAELGVPAGNAADAR